jgi:hypothetical protein
MFARNLSLRLKPNTITDFTHAFEHEVLPILRRQAGFRDEVMLAADGSANVKAISFWDTKEQADAYEIAMYPGILQSLERFLDAPPKVRVTLVISSTMNHVDAKESATFVV